MNHKTLTTTLIIAFSITAAAQRTMVVTDAETGVPIRDVQIFVNGDDNNRIVTDYKGEFIVPDTAGNLTLCHRKYEKRLMDDKEFADTISLLPNYNHLNELVVKGKSPKINMNIMAATKMAALTAPHPKTLATFDFFDIFTAKKRKKTRKRIEAIKDY